MNEDEQLRTLAAGRTKTRSDSTVKLADAIQRVMENKIAPRQERYNQVARAWKQILPPALLKHCRISNIHSGVVRVRVDSPAYIHELKLSSPELLKQLRQSCPRAKITKIQFFIG